MNTFLNTILSGMDLAVFAGYFAIAFFAAVLSLILRAERKRKMSINTPDVFSWGFFFRDNITTFLINILFIPPCILFSNNVMGQEITGWVSFLIGFTLNELIVKLERFQEKARE
jgi:hypothetical protein